MKEVKSGLKQGLTLEQAKAYRRTIQVKKVWKWAGIATAVVSAVLLARYLYLLFLV